MKRHPLAPCDVTHYNAFSCPTSFTILYAYIIISQLFWLSFFPLPLVVSVLDIFINRLLIFDWPFEEQQSWWGGGGDDEEEGGVGGGWGKFHTRDHWSGADSIQATANRRTNNPTSCHFGTVPLEQVTAWHWSCCNSTLQKHLLANVLQGREIIPDGDNESLWCDGHTSGFPKKKKKKKRAENQRKLEWHDKATDFTLCTLVMSSTNRARVIA